MARKRIRPQIEIERNVVEKTLMDLKSFIRTNRLKVLYSSLAVIILLVLFIGGFAYYEYSTEQDLQRYEKIMDKYSKNVFLQDENSIKETIKQLENFIETTHFGFAHVMAYYSLGNIYYSQKDYTKAKTYLMKFADKSSDSILRGLALIKAGSAMEQLHELDSALNAYKEAENDYSESIIADQIYFQMAGVYAKKEDGFNAKKYYDKIISSYSQSPYSAKAKKMLFLFSVKKAAASPSDDPTP